MLLSQKMLIITLFRLCKFVAESEKVKINISHSIKCTVEIPFKIVLKAKNDQFTKQKLYSKHKLNLWGKKLIKVRLHNKNPMLPLKLATCLSTKNI